jgi:hypothetical protein
MEKTAHTTGELQEVNNSPLFHPKTRQQTTRPLSMFKGYSKMIILMEGAAPRSKMILIDVHR